METKDFICAKRPGTPNPHPVPKFPGSVFGIDFASTCLMLSWFGNYSGGPTTGPPLLRKLSCPPANTTEKAIFFVPGAAPPPPGLGEPSPKGPVQRCPSGQLASAAQHQAVGAAGPDSQAASGDEISTPLGPSGAGSLASKACGRGFNKTRWEPSVFGQD